MGGLLRYHSSTFANVAVSEWGNPNELPSVYSGIRTGMAGENHLIYRPALVDKGKEVHSSMRSVYTDNRWLYGKGGVSIAKKIGHSWGEAEMRRKALRSGESRTTTTVFPNDKIHVGIHSEVILLLLSASLN